MIKTFLQENHIQFLEKESLKKHITFKVGGNADFIALPSTVSQAVQLLKFLRKENIFIKKAYVHDF